MGWSSHTEPLKKLFQEMLSSNELSDVTLGCDDKIRFHSHKLVLSACSPVFQSIISENTPPNQSIFLKGIHSQGMKSILQFIYVGQTTVHQHRINNFLDAARSLEIKEISQTTIGNLEEAKVDPLEDKLVDSEMKKKMKQDREENKDKKIPMKIPAKVKQEKVIQERINEKCHICGKTFRTMSVYIKHMDKAHFIPCSKCDYKAETQALFIDHIQTTH